MGISDRLPEPKQSPIHMFLRVNSPLLPPASVSLFSSPALVLVFSAHISPPFLPPPRYLLVNSSESEGNCALSLVHLWNIILCGQFLFLRLCWTFTISLVEGEKLGFRCPIPALWVWPLLGGFLWAGCLDGGGYYKHGCLTPPVCPEFDSDKEGLDQNASPHPSPLPHPPAEMSPLHYSHLMAFALKGRERNHRQKRPWRLIDAAEQARVSATRFLPLCGIQLCG